MRERERVKYGSWEMVTANIAAAVVDAKVFIGIQRMNIREKYHVPSRLERRLHLVLYASSLARHFFTKSTLLFPFTDY